MLLNRAQAAALQAETRGKAIAYGAGLMHVRKFGPRIEGHPGTIAQLAHNLWVLRIRMPCTSIAVLATNANQR